MAWMLDPLLVSRFWDSNSPWSINICRYCNVSTVGHQKVLGDLSNTLLFYITKSNQVAFILKIYGTTNTTKLLNDKTIHIQLKIKIWSVLTSNVCEPHYWNTPPKKTSWNVTCNIHTKCQSAKQPPKNVFAWIIQLSCGIVQGYQ